jgi:hypothetical protein
VSDQLLHLPEDVRGHVWESLVSMLRVYAHAAGLNGDEYLVTNSSGAASVQCGECALRICFSPDTGAASWRLTQPEREKWGDFRMEEDGTLTFPAGPKELDAAAIDWVEQLVRTTRQPLGIC